MSCLEGQLSHLSYTPERKQDSWCEERCKFTAFFEDISFVLWIVACTFFKTLKYLPSCLLPIQNMTDFEMLSFYHGHFDRMNRTFKCNKCVVYRKI